MDREHNAIQWQKNSTAGTSDDSPNRSFHKRVGSTLQWNLDRGEMVEKRTATPHKCFRTDGCKICSPDFHKKSVKFIYSYPDGRQSCPIVSLENEGGYSLELLKINKSIWHYLLSHGIIISAEYLPSKLNVQANWESRNARDPSDWKLHQSMFQGIIKHFG